ncbi:phage tail protein [Enterococcus faecium]|uniref:phage tail protein n=1 Tax=Enterococcus faecium TaxID=1352 RepID=UPI00191296CC|nr:phage tail protein [Enterococcus faecium]MBK5028613.1 phage tail protein [Enterococcus faecium]MBK5039375.1 phage tail protein [Enterococcus faecium]MBK5044494.1 phage tail protein [Enterococcus faecium]MBK5069241.1 phage tail protein [Enterococcus faecium]MBK5132467.1 phage tail protein [Enterococcus faecium]
MYRVLLYDNPNRLNPRIVHEPYSYGEKIKESEVYLSLNGLGISTFEFTFNINNKYYQKIEPIINFIQIIDVVREKEIFYGRVAKITNQMDASGSFSQSFLVEDEKAFLYDSVQTYMKPTRMTVRDYLQKIIDTHNKQVEPYKRFKLGNVDVIDNGDLLRGLGYQSTAETIKEKLLDRLTGNLILRRVGNTNYLDYVSNYGNDSDTPLQLTKNLKSATRDIDISALFTRIVPVGQDIEDNSETDIEVGTDYSRPKYTIESVNEGKNYLDDPSLIEKFGLNIGIVEFSNVKEPSILKRRGQQWLKDQSLMLVTWDVEAIELGLLDSRYELITLGNSYKVDNQFLYSVERLQVIEKKFSILAPQKVNLTIGSKKKKLTDYQNEIKTIQSNLVNIKANASAGTQSISDLMKKQESLKNELSQQNNEITNLSEGTQKLSESINSIKDGIAQVENDLSSEITDLKKSREESDETISSLIKRVENLENK